LCAIVQAPQDSRLPPVRRQEPAAGLQMGDASGI